MNQVDIPRSHPIPYIGLKVPQDMSIACLGIVDSFPRSSTFNKFKLFDLEKHRISVLFVEKQWDLYIDNKEKTNTQFFRNFINQKLSLPFHPQHMRGIKSIFKY